MACQSSNGLLHSIIPWPVDCARPYSNGVQSLGLGYAMFNLSAIDKFFPFDKYAAYREGQREAIEFALNAYNEGKRIVILECPTGGGKSAIGVTIANMVHRSYYLTITKVLQDQLVRDFGESIVELKGRNSYPCTYWRRFTSDLRASKLLPHAKLQELISQPPGCGEGRCRRGITTQGANGKAKRYSCDKCFTPGGPISGTLSSLPAGMEYSACPYYEQVFQAVNSRQVVLNFSSFLYQTQMTKRFDIPRDLMIIDECHNAEPQLLDFVSLTISDLHLQKYGIFIPELEDPYEYAVWFDEAKVNILIGKVIQDARDSEDVKLEDEFTRLYKKYELFMSQLANTNAEWVSEYKEHGGNEVTHRSITLKPVTAQRFAHSLLFKYANRVLMMSATVLDARVMCRSLGIDKDHMAAYRMQNRFPVQNRPIYIQPAAKMTGGKANMHVWQPKLIAKVNDLVAQHKGQRGIIHTHNFAITAAILEKCKPEVRRRMLNQHDFRDKREMLQAHADCPDSVLVAPAMHEGIDLVGDLSRFQIICKVPYANFVENPQLARRIEIDHRYYTWLTALKLVQSYGRSVRSETDWAATYIIDESIYKFLNEASKMLPQWFTDAIQPTK